MPNIAMTAADIVKWIAWGRVTVTRIHGWNAQATDLYIQLHQIPPTSSSSPAITAGAIPVFKSILAQAANGFLYEFVNRVDLPELTIAISSTEATYTAVGANGGLDMTIEVDSNFLVTATDTITGNLTTGRDGITVWTDAVANSLTGLERVTYTNNDGATRYLAISIDNGVTIADVYPVANGATKELAFGISPETMYSVTSPALTPHYGCLIFQSSSPTSPSITTSAVSYIRAIYRT